MLRLPWTPTTTIAALLLAGCAAMTPTPEPPPLDGTAWVLATLPGSDPVAGATATLRFEGGRASGSDGCNRYTVPYTARGAAFEVAPNAASTQMACAADVMRQAGAFMAALTAARGYRVDDGRLQLLSAHGTMLATLSAQPQTLAGTSWRATAIHNGRGGLESVAADATVTLAVAADGQAGGLAGCNRYSTRVEADGARVRFAAPASTRRMCPDSRVMAQEQAFLKALEASATMRVEGDRLELRDAGGAMMATFVATPAAN
jgi:heat shock protein HslJ